MSPSLSDRKAITHANEYLEKNWSNVHRCLADQLLHGSREAPGPRQYIPATQRFRRKLSWQSKKNFRERSLIVLRLIPIQVVKCYAIQVQLLAYLLPRIIWPPFHINSQPWRRGCPPSNGVRPLMTAIQSGAAAPCD